MALQRTWGHVSRIQIAKSMNGASGAQLGTGRWHWSFNGKSNGSCIIICSPFIWTDKYKKKPWRSTAQMIGELHSAVPETCVVFILYVRSFQNVSSLTPLVSDRGVASWLKLLILRVHIVHGPMCRWPKLSHWCVLTRSHCSCHCFGIRERPCSSCDANSFKVEPVFQKALSRESEELKTSSDSRNRYISHFATGKGKPCPVTALKAGVNGTALLLLLPSNRCSPVLMLPTC